MWIAESMTGIHVYCIKKTESEVYGWLHQHFPIEEYLEVCWVEGRLNPIFERPLRCHDWIIKEKGMAFPEPLLVRKMNAREEDQYKRAISSKNRSFFDA